MTDDFDPERRTQLGDSAADFSQADHQHAATGHFAPAVALPSPLRFPGSETRHILGEMKNRHQHEFRERLRVNPRRVRNDRAASRRARASRVAGPIPELVDCTHRRSGARFSSSGWPIPVELE
jgi:hypothetical protein